MFFLNEESWNRRNRSVPSC